MPEPPPDTPVRMIRTHLRDVPVVPFPEGFGIRALRRDEGPLWTDVQRDAEKLFPIADDLFVRQFGDDGQEIERRCFFVVDGKKQAVGTISAWRGDAKDASWGRIHWVAVRPAYHRRGLAKAALAFALGRLAEWHERAFLDTSTGRLPALKMYLDFGFAPDLSHDPDAISAWRVVRAALDHPGLADIGL